MNHQHYLRTDLAAESPSIEKSQTTDGVSVNVEKNNFSETAIIKILNRTGEEQLGKPKGTYITISFGKAWNLPENDIQNIINTVAEKIKLLASQLLPEKKEYSILVVGLGNRYITSDALGPLTVKEITVTRHLQDKSPQLFKMLNQQNVSALAPGVLGQTGIETAALIKSAVNTVSPDLVVAIDALAAKSVNRLATTIQICDTGIAPGSGIGNTKQAINRETLGVPVIAVGVPTMVSSATLVYDALEKAQVKNISEELIEVLDNGISFFVTLNETDAVINLLSRMLSESIDLAFSTV
ncbi:MAG: GPR endopeptidase [Clostridia bacterium]|nr:GPR endopeptidase [Clostridia bacterium]